FKGPIIGTEETGNIMDLSLKDSYSIMKRNAKRSNNKIMYCYEDVIRTVSLFKPLKFGKKLMLDHYTSIELFGNGHILGASIIVVNFNYPGQKEKKIIFSADYAKSNVFFKFRDIPKRIKEADNFLVLESTYGTTSTKSVTHHFQVDVANILNDGYSLLLPSIALERIPRLLLEIKKLKTQLDVYIDTPLGIKLLNIHLIKADIDFMPNNVHYVTKYDREKVLNDKRQKIVITTSGISDNGNIMLYLSYALPNPKFAVYYTCYQPPTSTGSKLLNANIGDIVTLQHKEYILNAKVYFTGEFSTHAKYEELVSFAKQLNPKAIFINHGEAAVKSSFTEAIQKELALKQVYCMQRGLSYQINNDYTVTVNDAILENKTYYPHRQEKKQSKKNNTKKRSKKSKKFTK
ncbi:MAG: MBL fold metallo-hydrolase, partial [Clostridia bacterium]